MHSGTQYSHQNGLTAAWVFPHPGPKPKSLGFTWTPLCGMHQEGKGTGRKGV